MLEKNLSMLIPTICSLAIFVWGCNSIVRHESNNASSASERTAPTTISTPTDDKSSDGVVMITPNVVATELPRLGKAFRTGELSRAHNPTNEFELRLWVLFGIDESLCLIIKRTNATWTATKLRITDTTPTEPRTTMKLERSPLPTPQNGWDSLASQLREYKIGVPLEFSYDSEPSIAIPDEGYIILEVAENGSYANVAYRQYSTTSDGKRMITLCGLLMNEFEIPFNRE